MTATRREELAAIQAFVDSRGCLMEFVARALDDPHARPCGNCAFCRQGLLPLDIDPAIAQSAVNFLRRSHRWIEPRARWGSTGLVGRTGNIAADLRASKGHALCMWGDAGWGVRVKEGKYQQGRFDDELVDACFEMIRDEWRPEPPPGWVAAVPSLRRPIMVQDFAARLAAKLGLPFVDCLRKIRETPPQNTMENSAQQMANIAETFEVIGGVAPARPALLVDDVVDSRWTMTECAFVLRSAGSGQVYPLALAMMSGGGDGS